MWIGGARAVVLDDKDRMLLVKQNHEGRDIWMVPGGGIEDNESAAEAAAREILEETGLRVEIGRLIWHVEEVSDRGQRFVNFFMARLVGGRLQLGEDPEFDNDGQVLKEVRFMTKGQVQELPHVYPEALRNEIWEIIENDGPEHDAFRMRSK